jgi:hypothetical protein
MSIGRINDFLNSIPGYGGYRSKEKRRDADRLIRERLAQDYGQLADRLGRLATRFADDRDLAAVRVITKPHSRLIAFRDRVRSATYGYAPLFGETQVDETALDQIAAFDRSLADGLEPLSEQIVALEQSAPGSDEFTTQAAHLAAMVEGLHDRFDGRAEVIESGKSMEPKKIAALLGVGSEDTAVDRRPTAYNLHDGEAVTFAGNNHTVIGRVTAELPSGTWRDFQLKGGTDESWLRVPASARGEFYWLQKVAATGEIGSDKLQLGDTTFEREHDEAGTTEVIGQQGSSASSPVRYYRYRPFSGAETLHVYDWSADNLLLRGAVIDPLELQVWSREGREAV